MTGPVPHLHRQKSPSPAETRSASRARHGENHVHGAVEGTRSPGHRAAGDAQENSRQLSVALDGAARTLPPEGGGGVAESELTAQRCSLRRAPGRELGSERAPRAFAASRGARSGAKAHNTRKRGSGEARSQSLSSHRAPGTPQMGATRGHGAPSRWPTYDCPGTL